MGKVSSNGNSYIFKVDRPDGRKYIGGWKDGK